MQRKPIPPSGSPHSSAPSSSSPPRSNSKKSNSKKKRGGPRRINTLTVTSQTLDITNDTFARLPHELVQHIFSFLPQQVIPIRVNCQLAFNARTVLPRISREFVNKYLTNNLTLDLRNNNDMTNCLVVINDFLNYHLPTEKSPFNKLTGLAIVLTMLTELMEHLTVSNRMVFTLPGELEVSTTALLFDEAELQEKRFPITNRDVSLARDETNNLLQAAQTVACDTDTRSQLQENHDNLFDHVCLLEESIKFAEPQPPYAAFIMRMFYNQSDDIKLHKMLTVCAALIKHNITEVEHSLRAQSFNGI